jgi:glutathione S-transferase
MLKLIIGNKNYSSWSLRAWLHLRESGIDFEEVRVPLFSGDWRETLRQYTPAGRVPVLIDGDITIWDSFAIFEHICERNPKAIGWPADPEARALARSISAEMHSGFLAIREELPQNLRARTRRELPDLSEAARIQITRVLEIWESCRWKYGKEGPWLFGEFSFADIMYVPVALRFVSYGIPLVGEAREFIRAVCKHPAILEWVREAEAEPERIEFVDNLIPASKSPMTPG